MAQKRKKTSRWQFQEMLAVSLVLHGLFVLSTIVLPKIFPKQPPKELIEVSFEAPPPPPAKAPKPTPKVAVKQIVEQDEKQQLNDEIDANTKFLSAHNQVVKKQTVAEKVDEFKNAKSKGKKAEKLAKMDLKPQLDLQKIIEKHKQQEVELEKSMDENAYKFKTADAPVPKIEEQGNDSEEQTSASNDYLKDIEKGTETLLSTREFMYYSFYARIRRQLNQHWGGKVREKLAKLFKEGRSIASSENKVTKILITLDRKGDLVRVQVLNDSGVKDLDEAAVEAFKEAAPFPNPPAGIVDPDGTVKIQWDFILEA